MAGHSRLKDGVAYARLCPAIHVFRARSVKDVDARDKPGHDRNPYSAGLAADGVPAAGWAAEAFFSTICTAMIAPS